MPHSARISASSVRNFTFGVEDSLASTVGLLSGIASAQAATPTILVTGSVLIFTEALSMGVGSYLSDMSVRQITHHHDVASRQSVSGAVVMFISYFLSGFIPLVPYAMLPPMQAIWVSVGLSLLALFFLGVFNASLARLPAFRQGAKMLLLGGLVVISGILVGTLLQSLVGRI